MAESAPPIPTALAELQAWPHWVVWRIETRDDGKQTKVPYQAARPSTKASSTDPDTWGTYEQAQKALERGRGDGVGYVFAPDDEYCGIDFDKCVEVPSSMFAEALGPVIHGEVTRLVADLDSYTELSPTGTGLHVIVRGRINGSRNRTGKTPWGGEFEFYDHARFFTITGRHVAWTPQTIEARQDELDAITAELFPVTQGSPTANGRIKSGILSASSAGPTMDDTALEEKIRASKQGPKFAELFDRGAGDRGVSEADLALCNILAFWTGPSEIDVDRWFRRSALMRDKWDEKRGDTTYGGYTIARALEGRTAFYTPGSGKPAGAGPRPADDDVEMTPGEEISAICGLIDDPFVSGWRSSRQAKAHVVLTTRSERVLDLESWKTATSSPPVLAQEIGLQLGVEVVFKKENISRLNVLIGKFCELAEAATIRDRARELGEAFLQTAESCEFQMDNNQKSRHDAFQKLQETHPATKAKAENISLAAASVVLKDTTTGKRYVRVQWFVDYVKANATSSTVGPILDQMEAPEWWSRPGSSGKFKATSPDDGTHIWHRLYEVPKDWEAGDEVEE